MKYVFLTAMLLLFAGQSALMAQWQQVFEGRIPANALRAGYEADGTPLYIARVGYQRGTHTGKAQSGWEAAAIPYGGAELWIRDYDVFVGQGSWVWVNGGAIPESAIRGGIEADGRPLFIARAAIGGGLHPGKAHRGGGAMIPYGGVEHLIDRYEVLVSQPSGLPVGAVPPAAGARIEAWFTTGSDDLRLRWDSRNAFISLTLQDGSSLAEFAVGGGMGQNQRLNRAVSLPRSIRAGDVRSITIRHDGSPVNFGESYDNWDLQALQVYLVFPDGRQTPLYNSANDPARRQFVHRFTGDSRQIVLMRQ